MKFVIGAAQLGTNYGLFNKTKFNKKEFIKIEQKILKSKISFIDTAPSYGNSERLIGKSRLKKLNIITKIKIKNDDIKNIQKQINHSFSKSLSRLKLNKIYGLLIHDLNDLLGANGKEVLTNLKILKKKGLVKKIGISVYTSRDLDRILKFWTPDIVQLPLNLFDQRMLDSGWINRLNKRKIKIFVRSCFLQGMLIGNYKLLKLGKKNKELLIKFSDWCKKNNISRLRACLDFIRQFKAINFAVIGFDNLDQMNEIIDILKQKKKKIPKIFKCNDTKLIDPRKWNYNLKIF